jgi:hypothetical protein
MVIVLASIVAEIGFESQSGQRVKGQTKDYKICICCFSAEHTLSGSNNKDWLA